MEQHAWHGKALGHDSTGDKSDDRGVGRGSSDGFASTSFQVMKARTFSLARRNYVHAFLTTVAAAAICRSICKSLGEL